MNNLQSGIDAIVKAGIFDEKWYVAQYPDVCASGLSPIDHYMKYGVRLKRKPNPAFEARGFQPYGTQAPELARPAPSAPFQADRREAQERRAPAEPAARTDTAGPPLSGYVEHEQEAAMPRLSGRFSVEQLKLKLWGGFSRYAVDCLEEIKNDCGKDATDRAEAAYCLMQWFYVAENYSRAYENVLLYGMLCNTFLDKQFVIGSALCLIKLQRYREADELINTALDDRSRSAIYLSDYMFLKASIVRRLNPGEQGEKEQLEYFSNAFKSMGLAPIEKLYPEASFRFGNMTASASARISDQRQKVSILIPAFNAAGSISYVIRSLQVQTWRNIEIIVVDDCSTDNTSEVVTEIMAFDERVRLIRKPVNEGAYPARNTGLKEATGDLIMVHDSDDWSHPQKIEVQIRALNKTPGAVASMSNWIRVDDEFMPSVHSRPRNTIKSLSFPSLLFKKEIVDQIGPWAAVRVSGDAEFKTRIERYYGCDAIARISKVLSISLSRDGSLTQNSATHINTLHFGVRWQYLNLYDYFHALQLKHDPACEQCIAVSNAVVGNRSKRTELGESFDYVFVSDFVTDVALIPYIAATCAKGFRVAVYHWRNFEEDVAMPLSEKLYELCMQHRIGLLTCSDALAAKHVIFGNLEILRFRQDRFPSISTPNVIGLLQTRPRLFRARMREQAMLVQLRATIRVLFGKEMRLVAGSQRLAFCLRELGLHSEVDGNPLPPPVDTLFWCDREIAECAPHRQCVEVAYPSGSGPLPVDARRDGEQGGRLLPAGLPATEVNYREIDVRRLSVAAMKERISGADFYVYCPRGDDCDEFGCGVLEALALGIPAVLPPALHGVFGDAALYAEAWELEARIAEVWKDRPRYLAYARRGREFIRTHFSPDGFYERMQSVFGVAAAC